MEPMRVEGNLASLAAMVRSGTRKADGVAPAVTPTADTQATAPSLPESTRSIVGGLVREDAEPLRDEAGIEGLVSGLAGSLRDDPELALAAQGRIHPERVRGLA